MFEIFGIMDNRSGDNEKSVQSGSTSVEVCMATVENDQSIGHSQKKKRRGVIEKRRRDRINSSLAELRRLVPAAFEKQGSQKLEKAEILQLAVQHLRSFNANVVWPHDPDRFVAEYHSMGFRFCASEVDEFLSKEGVELHHPLRMRLNNHLQCFGAQRQNAFTASTAHSDQNQCNSNT